MLQEWEEALLPGNKADMFFQEYLGVDVSVSYEFRGLKVVYRLAKEPERVHHAAEGGGGEVREGTHEAPHHLLVKLGVSELGCKVQGAETKLKRI